MNAMAVEASGALAPDLWVTLLKSFAVLCIVLGLVLAVLFFLRRFVLNPGRFADHGAVKMVATHHVGPKERVILMDVMGEHVLIGVTPQQINYLTKINRRERGGEND